ncbi:hypothetical protein JXO52_05195 [bacterium]|nr:hypothetical protein [bacterium]
MKGNTQHAPYVTWIWSDREIEEPRQVKAALESMHAQGVRKVRIFLENCSYRFTDRPVLRAFSRTSQWARARDISFWLHLDPRQASRLFISRVNEKLAFLMPVSKAGSRSNNIASVKNSKYELQFNWDIQLSSTMLQEKGISLEPVCLERAFLFRLENGTAVSSTIYEITNESLTQFDMSRRICNVFGIIGVPDDQEWCVAAFPKFDSNLFDYFGRESNDLLCNFVEDLFDGCTHVDGFTWGEGGPQHIADPGLLPASLSLFNSFKAEYGYDIRDRLLHLILPVDNNQHIRVRQDYYRFLQRAVTEARRDFHRMMHAFFYDIKSSYYFSVSACGKSSRLVTGDMDPWQKAIGVSRVFADTDSREAHPRYLAELALVKSIGLCSESGESSLTLPRDIADPLVVEQMNDLMTLFSIRPAPAVTADNDFPSPSRARSGIANQIRYGCPEADTLVIFPMETIISQGIAAAEHIYDTMTDFISFLIIRGIQFDIRTASCITPYNYSSDALTIAGRSYKKIIYPYPAVVEAALWSLVTSCAAAGLPVYIGGSSPSHTSTGEPVTDPLPVSFDPADPGTLPEPALQPLFEMPDGAVGSCFYGPDCLYFMLAPAATGGIYRGRLATTIDVPESSGLKLFRLDADGTHSILI